jgi:hypothetical protein
MPDVAVSVDVDLEARVAEAHGITARHLLKLGGIRYGHLTARDLERWLLEEGLAVRNGAPDRLVPTERGRELGGALAAP